MRPRDSSAASFDHRQAGATHGAAAQMHDMPIACKLALYWHIGETPTLFLR
jgi:hypothetical protein